MHDPAMNCDLCGRFHDHGPGSAWKALYSGGPISELECEITRCRACVERHGPFSPQSGIVPKFSCGIVWRPADVPTTGVELISTAGQADTWKGEPPADQRGGS